MKNWRLLLKGGQINVTPDMTVLEEQVIFKKRKKEIRFILTENWPSKQFGDEANNEKVCYYIITFYSHC